MGGVRKNFGPCNKTTTTYVNREIITAHGVFSDREKMRERLLYLVAMGRPLLTCYIEVEIHRIKVVIFASVRVRVRVKLKVRFQPGPQVGKSDELKEGQCG